MFNVSYKLTSIFTNIANALRNKLEITESIKADDIPEIISECFADDIIGKILDKTIKYLPSVYTKSCTTIGNSTFRNCTSLISINFPVCTTIGSHAFQACKSLITANFSACTTIGPSAFQSCTSLTTANFPACTTIGDYAFWLCSSLANINFPTCTTIGTSAFANCYSLTNINFPDCTTIGTSAFANCFYLTTLFLGNPTICLLSNSNAFYRTPIAGYNTHTSINGSIFVPMSLLSAYQSATNWIYFSSRIFVL